MTPGHYLVSKQYSTAIKKVDEISSRSCRILYGPPEEAVIMVVAYPNIRWSSSYGLLNGFESDAVLHLKLPLPGESATAPQRIGASNGEQHL